MKTNLDVVFAKFAEQKRQINQILQTKNQRYSELFGKVSQVTFLRQLAFAGCLKKASELLTVDEYQKLCNLPFLGRAIRTMNELSFNIKHKWMFPLDDDCFYLLVDDYEHYWNKKYSKIKMAIFPHGGDLPCYEFVISDVWLKSQSSPKKENRAFFRQIESEFLLGYAANICFVVRIIKSFADTNIRKELNARNNFLLSLSAVSESKLKNFRFQMKEVRKKLMLIEECEHHILFRENLGDVSLINLIERFPLKTAQTWQTKIQSLVNNKKGVSCSQWRMIKKLPQFVEVAPAVQVILQELSDFQEEEEKQEVYYFFLDIKRHMALRCFYRGEWMAEVFVQSNLEIEYPIVNQEFFYVVKSVDDLQKEPLLAPMFQNGDYEYIWNKPDD